MRALSLKFILVARNPDFPKYFLTQSSQGQIKQNLTVWSLTQPFYASIWRYKQNCKDYSVFVSATHVSLTSVLVTYMCMHQGSPAELYCKKSWQHQVFHLPRKCESEINTVIIISYSCYSAQTTTVRYGLLCKWFKPLNHWSRQM